MQRTLHGLLFTVEGATLWIFWLGKKSQSAVPAPPAPTTSLTTRHPLLFFLCPCFFSHANWGVSKAAIGIPHMWALDRNFAPRIHWASRSRVIRYEISRVTLGWAHLAGGHSFCLAIPMWRSKWISMTILFLKRQQGPAGFFIDEFQ